MTPGSPSERGAPRTIGLAVTAYVASVTAVGFGLTAVALRVEGLVVGPTLLVLVLLAVLTWWSGPVVLQGQVRLTFSSIVLLSAMALLGPAGAGLVGIVMGPLQRGRVPVRARIFNTGQSATLGVVGGTAYLLAGGARDATELRGAVEILVHVGLPLLVADIVQIAVNLLLLAGIVRVSQGVPMRVQIAGLARSTGLAYIGYGVVAFLLVVLWQPAQLGFTAAALVLAPLLVARWAYGQYAEEVGAQERALHVLVAAVEAKAPHLAGHSARVAELSERMAEHLGLGPIAVADTRVAGMLHDLGQTTLPTRIVRGFGPEHAEELRTYPERGADLLRELTFLSGSLRPIAQHRHAVQSAGDDEPDTLPARIVGLADEFDLLTEVGTPDGEVLTRAEALTMLRESGLAGPELLPALESALTRRSVAGGEA
jgi:HD-GYP domain-containing protein (c-di-GMP phosphodiesterase class II)